jgi:hypothetical protein
MEYAFQNVNINRISFIDDRNDIKFEFLDSFKNSGKFCGELICRNILSLKMDIDSDYECFPVFVCDITIDKIKKDMLEYFDIRMQGGDFDIYVVCKKIKYFHEK